MATSITAKSGRLFVLKVSDGTSPTTFVTVGGINATDMAINNNPVDVTNAASGGIREWLPDGGVQELRATCEGIKDSLTTGAVLLQAASITRSIIQCQIVSGHGDKFTFNGVVNNWRRTGRMDDAERFSCEIVSDGAILYQSS